MKGERQQRQRALEETPDLLLHQIQLRQYLLPMHRRYLALAR